MELLLQAEMENYSLQSRCPRHACVSVTAAPLRCIPLPNSPSIPLEKFIRTTTQMVVAGEEFRLNSGKVLIVKARPLESPHHGMVFVIGDITEGRQLEKMRKEFIANVSHELRTPLSTMHSSVETLLAGDVTNPELVRRFLPVLMRKYMLSRIVEDLLIYQLMR